LLLRLLVFLLHSRLHKPLPTLRKYNLMPSYTLWSLLLMLLILRRILSATSRWLNKKSRINDLKEKEKISKRKWKRNKNKNQH
jgi:hypothetical protein